MHERIPDPESGRLGLSQPLLELLLRDEAFLHEEIAEADLLSDFCGHQPGVSIGVLSGAATPDSPTE